jgi:transposase
VKTATKPPQPIEKSTASASLLADVIVSKVADHPPVHRHAKRDCGRFGVDFRASDQCAIAEPLDPLY